MKAVGVDVFLWKPIYVGQSLLVREQKCGTKVPVGKYKKKHGQKILSQH
jgi:hypothetical protein